MIFFTSDLHFGHKNSITMCNRPFADIVEMDKALVDNWNSLITDDDEVYLLGDICLTRKWDIVYSYLKQLKGRVHLIRGNHDKFLSDPKALKHYFVSITDYAEVKFEDHFLTLSHYPMYDWNRKFRNSISLYGHIHTKDPLFLTPYLGRCYDVGVDANNYTPVSADEIVQRLSSVSDLGLINDEYQSAKVKLWGQREKEVD